MRKSVMSEETGCLIKKEKLFRSDSSLPAIAQISGATVLNYEARQPLRYNKDNLLNPWFVVER
jgi:hypothetical protein